MGSVILGIDPGSRFMGFAIIDVPKRMGAKIQCRELGVIKPKAVLPMEQRLAVIYENLQKIVEEYQPKIIAVEKAFYAKNVESTMKLGMARAMVFLVAAQAGATLTEISPNTIKKAVTGFGHASKEQVEKVLGLLTGIQEFPSLDSSDALAIAYTAARGLGSYV